jgi:hypothetical protein
MMQQIDYQDGIELVAKGEVARVPTVEPGVTKAEPQRGLLRHAYASRICIDTAVGNLGRQSREVASKQAKATPHIQDSPFTTQAERENVQYIDVDDGEPRLAVRADYRRIIRVNNPGQTPLVVVGSRTR